jgi:hypothetical protein
VLAPTYQESTNPEVDVDVHMLNIQVRDIPGVLNQVGCSGKKN